MKLILFILSFLLRDSRSVTIPVICYHNITINKGTENQLFISRDNLDRQLKTLSDSGYRSILPQDIYNYETIGVPLPPRAVMISFDDSRQSQAVLAAPLLERNHFRGVFFVMTVTLNKPGYLSSSQVLDLSRRGHTIGAHTYDHRNMKKLSEKDWKQQLVTPKRMLEKITGQPVTAFAYPYGVHTEEGITQLKATGYTTGFRLIDKTPCSDELFCIRRLMVNGGWSGTTLIKELQRVFP